MSTLIVSHLRLGMRESKHYISCRIVNIGSINTHKFVHAHGVILIINRQNAVKNEHQMN